MGMRNVESVVLNVNNTSANVLGLPTQAFLAVYRVFIQVRQRGYPVLQ